MKYSSGDLLELEYENSKIKCHLIEDKEDVYVLKLDSGYNIGVAKNKVKNIELIGKSSKKAKHSKKIKLNNDLPLISIIHTGGTIASKVDYETGGVYSSFSAEDLISMFPELSEIANINTVSAFNVMSEDFLFSHYQKLAATIKKEIENGSTGIIIGHGTDTLALTASALSFIFENLPIPVILVGSQRSSDRGSTDAAMNLICATEFITKTDFTGVAICMHESTEDNDCVILPSCKTKKLHTTRRDAFKPVNDSPIAKINYKSRDIEFFQDYSKKTDKKLIIKDKFEEKVGILRTYPNMHSDVIENFTKNNYKGLILESSGLGQAPTNIKENLPNYEAFKELLDSGCTIVLTSNCIFGRVHPNVYKNCRRLSDIGIIYGEDMLTETAFIKLSWLLANHPKEFKSLITNNLRGEIKDRTLLY